MMPLSMAALISGMTTLVATAPNLVVNSELERHGVEGFHFFSFTPFGLPILVLGIVYMCFARRWLTGDQGNKNAPTARAWPTGSRNTNSRTANIGCASRIDRRSWARPSKS